MTILVSYAVSCFAFSQRSLMRSSSLKSILSMDVATVIGNCKIHARN